LDKIKRLQKQGILNIKENIILKIHVLKHVLIIILDFLILNVLQNMIKFIIMHVMMKKKEKKKLEEKNKIAKIPISLSWKQDM
jgi:hypothetical protein